MADRDELFGDRPGAKPDDLTGATNTTLLAKAADKHSEMKDQLVGALRVVEDTKGTAAHIAGVLEGDREKMFRITQGLDEVESELTISGKLITNFAKRLYTDKVILAFAFLLVAGIAGIIVYATLNPNQKVRAGGASRRWARGGATALARLECDPAPLRPQHGAPAGARIAIVALAPASPFARVHPSPQIFNVPDAAVPNIPGVTTPSGSATRTPGLSPSP